MTWCWSSPNRHGPTGTSHWRTISKRCIDPPDTLAGKVMLVTVEVASVSAAENA